LPIYSDVLIFLFLFGQPWPERLALVLLDESEEKIEASFHPFGLLFIDCLKELDCEGILLGIALACKGD
jgi:hypothetical protein